MSRKCVIHKENKQRNYCTLRMQTEEYVWLQRTPSLPRPATTFQFYSLTTSRFITQEPIIPHLLKDKKHPTLTSSTQLQMQTQPVTKISVYQLRRLICHTSKIEHTKFEKEQTKRKLNYTTNSA